MNGTQNTRPRQQFSPKSCLNLPNKMIPADAKSEIDRGIATYVTAASEVMDGYPIDIM